MPHEHHGHILMKRLFSLFEEWEEIEKGCGEKKSP